MKKNSSSGISAQNLRWVLVGIIVITIAIGVSGVWYFNTQLTAKIDMTNEALQSSQASTTNIERAQALKIYLKNHNDDIQKAAKIISQTTGYAYQNQVVEDVTRYANIAGVTITGFTFPEDSTTATTDKATGLKTMTATITLGDSTPYPSYLLFLKYIEQNLTKIQITDIALTPDTANQNNIKNTTIGIQVYVQ